MTDVDTLRTQLDDLITWWPHLTDHAATLHGITGHGLNLTATPHTGTSSVETAATEHIHLTNITTPLETIATEWAWRGHHHDGNLLTYLRSRLSWAANHFPWNQSVKSSVSSMRKLPS
ncbi:hypothetical protein EJ997_10195 [Flaviflexus ciconiae]|uniref:Uncharacterized protein n=1 Tax=Flaviflexus ciconiae TaxID=2496867 RepID=A0A3S9PZ48_9ACTO|nr:hypothetical protein [Flaviflexus ciconiae]AZQ77653.1 hypothetical protein EJ997_10195 [Flaviflexus ciconiae]